MQIGRVTVEILRPVPLEPLGLSAKVVRPGRSVELLESSLSGPHGELMRARAWRLQTGASREGQGRPPAGPGSGEERDFFPTGEEVGYHTAMDYRFLRGAFWDERGRIGRAVQTLLVRSRT
jgi:hypothetical protein